MNDKLMLFQGTGSQYLNSDIFTRLGYYTGTSSDFVLNIAFLQAERETARQINTYWLPTTVTGSYANFSIGAPMYLEVGMVTSIESVRFVERNAYGEERYISGTGWVVDEFNGIVKVAISPDDKSTLRGSNISAGGCGGCPVGIPGAGIYRAEVSYTAGYASGTWSDPTITTALCMVADQVLKILRDEGELPDEDMQFIKQYSVGRYAQSVESRWALPSRFGFSGRAQLISKWLEPWKIKRVLIFSR